jgi:1-acyl-sn-glycerol-3-phosphate acyltransferase
LIVANHVSWLDILAINAAAPVRFISKSEVKRWPILGALVTAGGTLYLERERSRDAVRVIHQMASALMEGATLAVFPEGTTSSGHAVLPFHANLLQAAISAQVPVQAIALRYRDAQHTVSPAPAYIGDTTLLQSAWAVMRADKLCACVTWLPAKPSAGETRRGLAQHTAQDIEAVLEEHVMNFKRMAQTTKSRES